MDAADGRARLASAWASGIRLYLVVCAIGLPGHFD